MEVTIIFKDQKQFETFLETNHIEDYTWHKGRITIDLSKKFKAAEAEAPAREAEIAESKEASSDSVTF